MCFRLGGSARSASRMAAITGSSAPAWASPAAAPAHTQAAPSTGTSWQSYPGLARNLERLPLAMLLEEHEPTDCRAGLHYEHLLAPHPEPPGQAACHWPGFTPPAAASRRRSNGRLSLRRAQTGPNPGDQGKPGSRYHILTPRLRIIAWGFVDDGSVPAPAACSRRSS